MKSYREIIEKWVPTQFALALVFLLHLIALFLFFPPSELLHSEPVLNVDYSVHTYRVHVYREALHTSGTPWGYDPDISAGATMDPAHDAGAKPMQVLGVLLPWLSAGQVVKLFLYLSVLSLPIWILLACRLLSVPNDDQVWTLLAVITPLWLVGRVFNMMSLGLVSFLAASYISVFVVAVFLVFLARPGLKTYAGLSLAAALVFLLHVLGPVVILPVLASFAFLPGAATWTTRFLLTSVPGVAFVLNSFWAVPMLIAHQGLPTYVEPAPPMPPSVVQHMTMTSVADLVERVAKPHYLVFLVLGLTFGYYGIQVMRKRVGDRAAAAVGITIVFGLLITFGGSFIPAISSLQPNRFVIPTIAFLAIPMGMAGAEILRKLRFPVVGSAVGAALLLIVAAAILGRPESLDRTQESDVLHSFILEQTSSEDRLLIQSRDGYRMGAYETKAFPLMLDREVIGSNFPNINDPPQFLSTTLFGQEIPDWEPSRLQPTLARWGVSWVFTRTEEADTLFARTLGEPHEEVGKFLVFRVPADPGRFLVGRGDVQAEVNRFDLSELQPENGIIVLRYRYHPGWESADGSTEIERVHVPEDPAGFIGLRNPPEDLTLTFDPLAMLHAEWPQQTRLLSVADVK